MQPSFTAALTGAGARASEGLQDFLFSPGAIRIAHGTFSMSMASVEPRHQRVAQD
jgi:hypothetical protein